MRAVCVPPELRPLIDALYSAWKWLVPTWVHTLNISLNGNIANETTLARVRPRVEYRAADLEIASRFLNADAVEREDAWVHEFVHLNLAPIQRWCETIVEDAEHRLDPLAARVLRDSYTQALEASTQDLTRAIHARLHANGPTPE